MPPQRHQRTRAAVRLILQFWIAALCVAPTLAAEWGTLTGRIAFDGPVPKPLPQIQLPDGTQLPNESLLIDPNSGGILDIIVHLRGTPVAVHADYEKTKTDDVSLTCIGMRLHPRVTLLRTSQTLKITNRDAYPINIKVDTYKNPAINPLIQSGEFSHTFSRSEKHPVFIGCNIKPWITSMLVIKDHPYVTVSGFGGDFTIKNLPTGKHTFEFRHPTTGYLRSVRIAATATSEKKQESWNKGRKVIEIKPGQNDLGTIYVPASQFKTILNPLAQK